MFHNPGYFRMIYADKASALKIRMEIFKKYAIRIGFFSYICSINMPYCASKWHKYKKIFKTI